MNFSPRPLVQCRNARCVRAGRPLDILRARACTTSIFLMTQFLSGRRVPAKCRTSARTRFGGRFDCDFSIVPSGNLFACTEAGRRRCFQINVKLFWESPFKWRRKLLPNKGISNKFPPRVIVDPPRRSVDRLHPREPPRRHVALPLGIIMAS